MRLLSKNRPVKGKLDPTIANLISRIEFKKQRLLAASKNEIKAPETIKAPEIKAASAAPVPEVKTRSMTPAEAWAILKAMPKEQFLAAARLDFATNLHIRDEFGTEERYVAFMQAKRAGKIRIHGPQHRA